MRATADNKIPAVARLVAGLPLLGFGVLHFIDPQHMREILIASGIPMVEANVVLAPAGEVVAGALLLLGWYARIGGVMGAATMLVAAYSTIVLSRMTTTDLPEGLTEIPSVPPLPLPIVLTVCSVLVAVMGGGAWSLDLKQQSKSGSA